MDTDLPETEPQRTGNKALARATSRGFSWMSVSLVVGRAILFVAQVVLGWILTQEDFGVFAIVAAVIAFAKVFHSGGVPLVLVQRGNDEYERLQGAAFWMGMCFSVGAAIVLAAAAPWIGQIYDEKRLVPLLWILAVTLPLGSPASLLRAKLQLDLRFRAISLITVTRVVIRSVGMIVLAFLGSGIYCFVIPMLFVAVFEDVATYLATRATPWLHPARFREWPMLLKDSYWVIFATIFRGLSRNGDVVVLGLLIPQTLLGCYFFGYQLTIQITYLVALTLRQVLFPVMSKFASQPQRHANAIVRTVRMLMLLAAPASMLIAAIIRPAEEIIWKLKWAEAVPLMQVFSVVAPILILTDVAHSALTSRGQFRRSGLVILAEGLWLMGSAWLAVMLAGTENITAIAIWIFGLQIAFALVVNTLVLKTFHIQPMTFLRSVLPQWAVALVPLGAALAVGRLLPDTVSAVVEILVLATIFLTVYVGAAWVMLRSEFQDMANVAPRPIAIAVRKLFMLPQAEERSSKA